MTLIELQPSRAHHSPMLPADASYASGPRVGTDMTVEVALSVMSGARADHLFLCDEDDQCTGLVTRAQLAVVRDSPSYTDSVRLSNVIDANGAFAMPVTATRGTELAV